MFAPDISHHQGAINFNELSKNKEKIDVIIIRASEGATNIDNKFLINVKGASSIGVKWGAYHFATWNKYNEVQDAKEEANFFISQLKKADIPPSYTLWLDCETNNGKIILSKKQLENFMHVFMGELHNAGYEDIGNYMSPGFASSFLPLNHTLNKYKLWISHYTNKSKPQIPKGFEKYDLWQYTDKGKVLGISTHVDLNRGRIQ